MSNKQYDLENRLFTLVITVSDFCKKISASDQDIIFIRQLMRSVGSIGANYIEARDPLGQKDELKYLRIARKESRESSYWFKILCHTNGVVSEISNELDAIKKILSSIILKVESNHIHNLHKKTP